MNLETIKDPAFLKDLSVKELTELAKDIRAFLIENISKTGGHLASNLGVVEMTIAMHYVFDSPNDQFIFDVGHQAYTHKILTGRAKDFSTLRKHQGLSGYISYKESPHDLWESGHAGTSISAMAGFLYANEQNGHIGEVISMVGDASITSGMSFEGLNTLGSDPKKKGIIILNDNNMSISKNVGSLSRILTLLRGNKFIYRSRKIFEKLLPGFVFKVYRRLKRVIKAFFQSGNIFEELGFVYIGPVNGNDLKTIINALKQAKKMKKSVVIHAISEKGKGYDMAEQDDFGDFHGVSPFDVETGVMHKNNKPGEVSWSEVVATALYEYQKYQKTFVIMPAMIVGTKFSHFYETYQDRMIDVGIAEEHAASMAAAMALRGVKVFLPLYATFAQRAYDQILNDIARPDLNVVIGVDRAGFVGDDGSTHQGIFDVSMFYSMPNMIISMPYDSKEAFELIAYGFSQKHPMVIRYPRGTTKLDINQLPPFDVSNKKKWYPLETGTNGYLIGYGDNLNILIKANKALELGFEVLNARFIKPIDVSYLDDIIKHKKPVFIYEDVESSGSLYPQILRYLIEHGFKAPIGSLTLTNKVINHGSIEDNKKDANVSYDDLLKKLEAFKHEIR
ncbi:MAG TPA: 1-deoxy-D-xylulose-5-phosphate synthase [Acholeplasma sp.]|nr:1-deoxy-D-xylulose-5-phosphate synthase [Acholeplasma sp.]